MGQINIKKSSIFLNPPVNCRGYGFDSAGNPVMILEDGSTKILAAGNNEYIDVTEIEVYNPANTYLEGRFVSYDNTIFLCVQATILGESPETAPLKWESQGTNMGAIANIVYTDTIQTILGRKHFRNRLLLYQPTDIAPSQNLTLPNGYFFRLRGSLIPIHLINSENWTGGSPVTIEFPIGTEIKHMKAPSGLNHPIKLACGTDYTATQDILIQLVYDEVDLIWKEFGGITIATIVEPPSPKIIYATFQELTNLKAANQIIAGQFYKITDYATKHVVNDSTNTATATIHTEDVEPLLVLGIAINKIHKQVYSEQYPNDIIYYDITNVLCEDSSTARKGIITYRKDEWENEAHFDFRGTKVYDGANNVYIFANSRNPGNDSFYGNKIGINSTYNTYNNYFLFGIYCWSNTLGNDCDSNTLGDGCYSNILGDNCYSNILGNGCYSNTLGNACDSNILGDDCNSNTLGDGCNLNILGNDCISNILGDSCYSNTLGDGCNSNTLGYACYSNTFENYCYSNTFGDACYSNTFGMGCSSNVFGDNCFSNVPDTGNTDNILNTTFENGVSDITYEAAATHLSASYHKVVFKYPDGTKKLRYFDNAGALQIVDVND